MFSKEINDLLNGNNLEVLKILAKYEPEKFRANVNSVDSNGMSFFMSLIDKNNNLEYVKDLLELCESFGYKFNNQVREYKGKSFFKNTVRTNIFPEYLVALTVLNNDKVARFLTEKIGNDSLLEMEKEGWQILEYAYSCGFADTVEILCDYGFNYENPKSGQDILKIAANNQKMVDLYWKIKEKKSEQNEGFMSNMQFDHFLQMVKAKLKSIDNKKDYRMDSILRLVDDKKDLFSKDHKEKLLVVSITCKDLSLYKKMVKLLGYKLNSEEIKNITLANLDKIQTHDLLYPFVEEVEYLFKNIKSDESPTASIHGIDMVASGLQILSLNPYEKYQYHGNGNKAIINRALADRLNKIFKDEHIVLRKFSNGENFFEKVALNKTISNKFLLLLNIHPKPDSEKEHSVIPSLNKDQFALIESKGKGFTKEQKDEIRTFLEKTWLAKNENKQTVLDRVEIKNICNQITWIFSECIITDNEIFKLEEKETIFSKLVNEIANPWNSSIFSQMEKWGEITKQDMNHEKLLKNLYVCLTNNPATNWKNIILSEETKSHLKNTEFIFELKARQLKQTLSNDLHDKTEVVTKKPRKI